MLMYLHKKRDIQFGYILVNLAGILLIFMKPAEVFYILNTITNESWDAFDKKEQNKMRWHVTPNKQMYSKLLSTFKNLN